MDEWVFLEVLWDILFLVLFDRIKLYNNYRLRKRGIYVVFKLFGNYWNK